jgi:hypothetical protein
MEDMGSKKILSMILLVILIAFITPTSGSQMISGIVFNDTNMDGLREDESGISRIEVSNGINVTVTNESGYYELPKTNETEFVFITTPSEYTPTTSWYHVILNNSYDFGLYYTPEKKCL